MLSLLLAKLAPYLVAAGAGLAALVGIYLRGKSAGKTEVKTQQTEQALQQAKDANAINQTVRSDSDAVLADELRKHQRD